MTIYLMHEDQPLVATGADIDTLRGRDWWHFTTRPSWPNAGGRLVHLGTLEAALSRTSNVVQDIFPAEAEAPTHLSSFYFHKVLLHAETVIPDIVVEDQNNAMSDFEYLHPTFVNAGEVLRYVNSKEAPGRVALALRDTDVEVVDTVTIPFYSSFLSNLQAFASSPGSEEV